MVSVESAIFCTTRCVVLLCRRSEEPFRPIREPKADASAVFADPGMFGRGTLRAGALGFAPTSFEGPPATVEDEMADSCEAMLV